MQADTPKKKGRKPLDKAAKMVALPIIRAFPAEREQLMREASAGGVSVSAYMWHLINKAMRAVA